MLLYKTNGEFCTKNLMAYVCFCTSSFNSVFEILIGLNSTALIFNNSWI